MAARKVPYAEFVRLAAEASGLTIEQAEQMLAAERGKTDRSQGAAVTDATLAVIERMKATDDPQQTAELVREALSTLDRSGAAPRPKVLQ